MYYIDAKYLKLIGLEQFTDKGQGKWNFRCPVCGDSNKSKTLKRGWALSYNNTIIIKCFNCEMAPLHISRFLKLYRPNLYAEYMKETFLEKGTNVFRKEKKKESSLDVFSKTYDSLNLQLISELPENHKAVQYLLKRKITADLSSTFYYTDDFYKWVHESIDNKYFNFLHKGDKRIVIPFFDRYNKIFAVQGRTIEGCQTKYLTVKTVESENKLYGLNNIDFSKTIYIVEGPIDSLFLDNCLAMAGTLSNIDSLLKYTNKENIIIVPDNDRRNKQTHRMIEDALKSGYKTVIWPSYFNHKDINDIVVSGFTKDQIYSIISKNTFSGLRGWALFKMKSK